MAKAMKVFNRVMFLALWLVLILACSGKETFSEYQSFPDSNWSKDLVGRFEVNITDTISRYDINIEVRNRDNYPFRNLWLFVDFQTPDKQARRDTMNCELADVYGRWHGNGLTIHTMEFPYDQNVGFSRSGTYVFTIHQGMREDPLAGISDIGLVITKRD